MSKHIPCQDGQLVAVVSDTHGFVPRHAVDILKKADLIIHAGDIDTSEALETLRGIGPVVAVRGNMDGGHWANGLSRTEVIKIEDVLIYVLHDLWKLDVDPVAAGFNIVVSGHTHRPLIEKKQGILFVNPGSLGLPRENRSASLALICVKGDSISSRIVEL
jgi:hypothetical protein